MNAAGIFSATGGRKRMAAALMVALFAIAPAFAINFPALTGRVVDQANIIQPDTRAAIEQKLADLETKSGIQLVVATVNSLEGQDVEPYANELFRKWALGEKKKNNGVLLLVAPNERRVRIEVGYGLEGTLTDALSKVIIFVDEADTQFGGVGSDTHETERRLTGKLQAMMSDTALRGRVALLLVTARIHQLSPDIRRPGRVGDLIGRP